MFDTFRKALHTAVSFGHQEKDEKGGGAPVCALVYGADVSGEREVSGSTTACQVYFESVT